MKCLILLVATLVLVIAEDTESTFDVPKLSELSQDEVAGHRFQAEINQLMGLIVNSLYSNRDIFVRELVSNAADALDKIRYMSLTEPGLLGNTPALEIRIKVDPENKLIHIRDTGIGMTREELVNNLGSIAKSGTKDFVKKVQAGAEDLSQIGQFGVGFYSSFLVADRVTVVSKSNDDDQYVWESAMDETTAFSVAKDPRGNTLGRGTLITLHLKEDALEYASVVRMKNLIQHYNQFLTFPIFVWESSTVEVEAPVEEPIADKDIEVKEEGEEEEEEPKAPTTQTVWEWQQVNSVQPLWTRKSADITEEEYTDFYKSLDRYAPAPLKWSHFRAEGEIEFTSLLYIPTTPPAGSTDFASAGSHVKLYVKKVFISDTFTEFLPDYLNFIRGVVDSDDLPLNVSREILQQNKLLQVIQKKLVRKILAMIADIMADEDKADDFYDAYHQFLKMGVIKDPGNKDRIAKLLRYNSVQSSEERLGFEDYVANMKEGQKDIFYLGGENKESLLNSPLLERLIKKGYDVLLFTDPLDEYVVMHLQKYDSYKLVDVGKEGLKMDESDKEKQEKYKTLYEPLTDYLKDALKKHISAVEVSVRLSTSPCALVSSSWGMSANLERIVKAQAISEKQAQSMMNAKKVLEINPRHPIMEELLRLVSNGKQNEKTLLLARMIYDSAVLSSGYSLEDPIQLSDTLNKLVAETLRLDPFAVVEDEEETPEPVAASQKKDSEDAEDSEHEEL